MNKLTKWLIKPLIEEDINIPVDIGDTILVGRFKNKKMKIKDIGKDKHGMPTINGRKAATFRIHSTVNIFDEGVNDPGIFKAVFLAGGPGSGKTFVAGGLFGIPDKVNVSAYGLKMVNQDTELEMFLKKYFGSTDLDNMSDDLFRQITDPSYSAHMGVRVKAKALSKQRLKLYSQGRLGVIVDGTGHKYSEVKKERQKLIDLGYDTYMVFVNTSLEVAQMRNKLRDRVLPSELVEKYWNNVQKNMAFFQGLFGGSNFMLVDNNATLKPKQAQKKFNMLVKKGISKFIKKPIKSRQAKKWLDKQKILKKNEIKELFPSVDGTIPSPSRKRVKKNKTDSMGGYEEIDECIAVAKKFGDDIVLGKNRDRNYNPNLKVVRELSGYGVELCYVVDQDTDWTEGMNSEGIGLVNSALFVKRDEKDFDKAKKKKAMSKDGVRIREALQHKTLQKAVKSLITYQDGIKGHTIVSDGKKVVIIENTSRVEPAVTIHDIEGSPVVRANHGVQHSEQGYQRGPDKLSSQLRAKNALDILAKEEDYKKFFPAFYNHTQNRGAKYDLVRAQNKLWTSSQLMMNLNKKELTLYLIPGAVKFLGIENTLPNDYKSEIKLKIRQYEHGPSDKYDTYVTTDKKKKKSAIKDKDTAVVPENKKIKKLQKVLDLYGKSVVYSIMEDGDSALNLNENKIKKVVGVYGGRFQPFGPHHKKTYEWLKKQVDDAYITTSDIKQPPRHPMNFSEKVRHMKKMGIPSNRIIKEKSPYVAKNVLSKYNKDTTAVIYIFGAKDSGRLSSGKYFQDYKKNKDNMNGYDVNGYVLKAPHISVSVGGKEVSGTVMRQLLGSPAFEKDREKLFKTAFGYFDKGIYTMMTNKFKKLFESIEEFLINNDISKLIKENSTSAAFQADDGPPIHYRGFDDYKKFSKKWIDSMAVKYGWEVVDYILGKKAQDPALDYTLAYNIVPAVAYGRKQTGDYGSRFGVEDPVGEYKKHLGRIVAKNIGYEIIKWFGIAPVGGGYTGVAVEAPILPGISKDNTTNTKIASKKGEKTNRGKPKLNTLKENLDLTEYVNLLVSNKPYKGKELLLMGGAYGHMNHPFDDKNITFSDLKNIIILGLGGKLNREDGVTEKLDGQNLMVSWVNGKLVTARNKGQLKNFGSSAMDVSGVASKFAGRGDIRNAFVYAMKDLSKSIGSLSDAQKEKVFGNGKRWMNLEVIYPASANVVDYDKAQIVFHGTLEYNESGTSIGQPTDSARMLAGMITQVNQHIQKHYAIGKPQFLTVPKVQDFGKKKSTYLNRLRKLQNQYRLKDSDTLGKYHQSYWEAFIYNAIKQHNAKISNKVLINLTKRWAFFDKSYSIPQIKKDLSKFPKFLDWVLSFDKNDHQKWVKDNMKPFEVLFFDVGAEILKNISGYLAVSPDKAVQRIRKDVISAIRTIKSGGDVKKIQTLKHQLEKLEAIGGLSSIVPTEGIVFKYKGKTYKFTGAFAPVNQILGLLNF